MKIFVGVVEVYEDDSSVQGTGVLDTDTRTISEIDGFPNGTREHDPVSMHIIMPSGNEVPIEYVDGAYRVKKDEDDGE